MARAMYPGYTGFRPRIQLWHGSADSIINYANYGEAVDQWTNVLGLSVTPTTTGTVSIGGHSYNRRQWKTPAESWSSTPLTSPVDRTVRTRT